MKIPGHFSFKEILEYAKRKTKSHKGKQVLLFLMNHNNLKHIQKRNLQFSEWKFDLKSI